MNPDGSELIDYEDYDHTEEKGEKFVGPNHESSSEIKDDFRNIDKDVARMQLSTPRDFLRSGRDSDDHREQDTNPIQTSSNRMLSVVSFNSRLVAETWSSWKEHNWTKFRNFIDAHNAERLARNENLMDLEHILVCILLIK